MVPAVPLVSPTGPDDCSLAWSFSLDRQEEVAKKMTAK